MTCRLPLCMWLLMVLATGCFEQSDGIVVDMTVMHHPGGGDALRVPINYGHGEARGTVTDLGFDVVLRQAYLTLGRMELLPCDDDAGMLAAWLTHARRLASALHPVSTAHAHGPGGPTTLDVAQVVDLTRADRAPLYISSFLPPPGDYCGVRVSWEPTEETAEGLEKAPWLLGWTGWISGEFGVAHQEHLRPFEVPFLDYRANDVPFVDVEGNSQRLTLSAARPLASIVLSLGYGMACGGGGGELLDGDCRNMLDQLDLASPVEVRVPVLDNLAANVRATVCRPGECEALGLMGH